MSNNELDSVVLEGSLLERGPRKGTYPAAGPIIVELPSTFQLNR